jgi:proteic killer suppression protein
MILRFRHKGLKWFYFDDDPSGLMPDLVPRIRAILTVLAMAEQPQDINLQGARLHPLSGDLKGFYSIWVRANWRIIFRFEAGQVTDVELVDYH